MLAGHTRRSLALAAGILLLTSGAARPVGCPLAFESDAIQVAVEPRENNALIADVSVDLASPMAVYIEYGSPALGWLRTPTFAPSAALRQPLVRLRAESDYAVRAFGLDPGGGPTAVAVASFRTGRLPARFKQSILESAGQPSFPLVLMDYRPKDSRRVTTFWLVALDQDGKVVWYYEVPHRLMYDNAGRSVTPFEQRANGNLLYLMKEFGFDEITPDQQLVRRLELQSRGATDPHHDFIELPDGRLLVLGAKTRRLDETSIGGPRNALVRGDSLHLFDPSTGAEEELWDAFDVLDPLDRLEQYRYEKDDGAEDWTHANSIDFGPSGNLLLSIKNLDQVISFAPDLHTIEWKLGGPDSSFSFPDPNDEFHGQHDVQQLPNGHILMFDNGLFRPDGDYSRALELALDFDTMTARAVWQYRARPDISSHVFGNVVRLPNGNTLVNFGWNDIPDEPIFAAEARPDGSEAWRQALRFQRSAGTNSYRMLPLSTLGGETAVEPTPFASS
jgi:hypothetical protein